jgi:hypothetical protein
MRSLIKHPTYFFQNSSIFKICSSFKKIILNFAHFFKPIQFKNHFHYQIRSFLKIIPIFKSSLKNIPIVKIVQFQCCLNFSLFHFYFVHFYTCSIYTPFNFTKMFQLWKSFITQIRSTFNLFNFGCKIGTISLSLNFKIRSIFQYVQY